MLFGGCATDQYAMEDSPRDTYRGAYRTAYTTDAAEERFAVQASEPIRMESGRRALSGATYRSALQDERPLIQTGYTEEQR